MSNNLFGTKTLVSGFVDLTASSMQINLTNLPTLVRSFIEVTIVLGNSFFIEIFTTGLYSFLNVKGLSLVVEPLFNDVYSGGTTQ